MKIPLPRSIGSPAASALGVVGITSLEELTKLTEKELADLHGVGPKAVRILKQCLNENNMSLRTAVDTPS